MHSDISWQYISKIADNVKHLYLEKEILFEVEAYGEWLENLKTRVM